MLRFFGLKACGILAPQPWIEPSPPCVGRPSLHPWAFMKSPTSTSLKDVFKHPSLWHFSCRYQVLEVLAFASSVNWIITLLKSDIPVCDYSLFVSVFLKTVFIYLIVPGLSCSTWDLVPQPGIKSWPLHWEYGILATRPPGKLLSVF